MLHEMRRKEREIGKGDIERILQENRYGILSSISEDGTPYGVPVSYFYEADKIYFHSALVGHKIDNLQHSPQVSFCVVGHTQVLPDKFSTEYESVIAFGTAGRLEGAEKEKALHALVLKYAPAFDAKGQTYIAAAKEKVCVYCIDIAHMTGKARK